METLVQDEQQGRKRVDQHEGLDEVKRIASARPAEHPADEEVAGEQVRRPFGLCEEGADLSVPRRGQHKLEDREEDDRDEHDLLGSRERRPEQLGALL